MREDELEAAKKSLTHWRDRMIPWVKNQDRKVMPNALAMLSSIGENWWGFSCALCDLTKLKEEGVRDCFRCCFDGPCGAYWPLLTTSKTWEVWLFYGDKIVKALDKMIKEEETCNERNP